MKRYKAVLSGPSSWLFLEVEAQNEEQAKVKLAAILEKRGLWGTSKKWVEAGRPVLPMGSVIQ